MTATDTTASTLPAAIDISRHRHEVLIGIPGKIRRRCLTILNTLEDFRRLSAMLAGYGFPVRVGFEAIGNYHRPLAHHLGRAGFDLKLVSSVALALTREALPQEARPLRFLIADDNETNRVILSAALERLGCSSKPAVDGRQAFDLVQAEDFDVVFMHDYMPNADGADVTRWIRALENHKKSIRIIGITASEAKDEQAALLQAGMTASYTKPLSNTDLVSILQTYGR